jgi:hypothetical protein
MLGGSPFVNATAPRIQAPGIATAIPLPDVTRNLIRYILTAVLWALQPCFGSGLFSDWVVPRGAPCNHTTFSP